MGNLSYKFRNHFHVKKLNLSVITLCDAYFWCNVLSFQWMRFYSLGTSLFLVTHLSKLFKIRSERVELNLRRQKAEFLCTNVETLRHFCQGNIHRKPQMRLHMKASFPCGFQTKKLWQQRNLKESENSYMTCRYSNDILCKYDIIVLLNDRIQSKNI